MIVGKVTKKMNSFYHDYISIINYGKCDTSKGEYNDKEYNKSENIHRICTQIESLIDTHKPDIVQMEGISYGSLGSAALADLAGLNFAIRMSLMRKGLFFNVIAPTSVKKFAVGNGGAEKDVIIESWKKLDRNISNIADIKVDDLADSYFISHYTTQ
jgi:Holliday junction resolvasome RuvABC endonuclease subunit